LVGGQLTVSTRDLREDGRSIGGWVFEPDDKGRREKTGHQPLLLLILLRGA